MYLRASPTSCSRRSVISKEETNVFQSVLVSNATPLSFFLQKILLPKLWGQAVVLNLWLSSNPLRILPNVRGLQSGFATTYDSKAYALPSRRRQHSARRLPIKQDGLVYSLHLGEAGSLGKVGSLWLWVSRAWFQNNYDWYSTPPRPRRFQNTPSHWLAYHDIRARLHSLLFSFGMCRVARSFMTRDITPLRAGNPYFTF